METVVLLGYGIFRAKNKHYLHNGTMDGKYAKLNLKLYHYDASSKHSRHATVRYWEHLFAQCWGVFGESSGLGSLRMQKAKGNCRLETTLVRFA